MLAGIEDGTARRTRPPVNHVAAAAVADHGTNNFATIRTTSIVTKQQKEHMQVLNKFYKHYKQIDALCLKLNISAINVGIRGIVFACRLHLTMPSDVFSIHFVIIYLFLFVTLISKVTKHEN